LLAHKLKIIQIKRIRIGNRLNDSHLSARAMMDSFNVSLELANQEHVHPQVLPLQNNPQVVLPAQVNPQVIPVRITLKNNNNWSRKHTLKYSHYKITLELSPQHRLTLKSFRYKITLKNNNNWSRRHIIVLFRQEQGVRLTVLYNCKFVNIDLLVLLTVKCFSYYVILLMLF
jgi:hypothetical protein